MPTKLQRGLLFLFALTLGGSCAALGIAQEVKQPDPSVERMRKDITYLASAECEGRGVGTKGLDKAADYIADQFAKAGLKPGGSDGTYFQPFPFATNATLDGASTITVQGPQGQKIALKQGEDFQVFGTSAAGKLSVPLVFVGYGVSASEVAYDDYAGVDVKGKAVVVVRRTPRWNSKDLPFSAANKDAYGSLENKQFRAQANKAAAAILINDSSELPADKLMAFETLAKGIITVSIPYVQIKRSVIDDILRSSTSKNLAETEKAIDADLKPRSTTLEGWTIHLDVRVKRQEIPVRNVIGVLEGSGPLANETVVVGAHYDHLGYGGAGSRSKDPKKKEIHHGADDNGSGTTTMIELSRRFAGIKNRQGRRMVFMAFTAEERGLIGSRHYCKVEPLFPLKDTSAMFNLDMVGRLKDDPKGGKTKLLVEGFDTAKEFDSLVTKLNPGFDIVKKNSIGFISSDQYSFYSQKIPVIFFWTGTHEDYHRPTDTSDRINVVGMKRIADYAEKVIDHLRVEPKRPEFVQIPFKFTPTGGGPQGPKLGIKPDLESLGKGVLVEEVIEGGAAAKAGIKKGDIILEIAGKAITLQTMRPTLAAHKANVEIEIKILRDKKELLLKVTPN